MAEALTFRRGIRNRLLTEMLAGVRKGGDEWYALIMDELTIRVMSAACKMSEIMDENVSLVEDINKDREPLPLAGIYFISPSATSIRRLIEDFSGKKQYGGAYVFFSSTLPAERLAEIKDYPELMANLKCLKELNLEFCAVESRTFSTMCDGALTTLYGPDASLENSDFVDELDKQAARLATVFASLHEFPDIRYRAARASKPRARDRVAEYVAHKLYDRLSHLRRNSGGVLPPQDTCECLILDRGFDPVAPIIHEWTYEALVYDLLPVSGSAYTYKSTAANGKTEEKQVLLEEHDALWLEMRHLHIAEASTRINAKLETFQASNKQVTGGGKDKQLDTRDLAKLVQKLPQYRDQLTKLGLHVDLGSAINRIIREQALDEVGTAEQDLVLDGTGAKALAAFLAAHPKLTDECRLRLVCLLAAVSPRDLASEDKQGAWLANASLSKDLAEALLNLEFLGVPLQGGKALEAWQPYQFVRKRKKPPPRKGAPAEDDGDGDFTLGKFTPIAAHLVEDLAREELDDGVYPHVRDPAAGDDGDRPKAAAAAKPAASSARSARVSTAGRRVTGRAEWARPDDDADDDAAERAARKGMQGLTLAKKRTGLRKMVVFILGGVTRSEMRWMHKKSAELQRDILIGSTAVESTAAFLEHLAGITGSSLAKSLAKLGGGAGPSGSRK